jgi:D-alanine-D-alanine ligase
MARMSRRRRIAVLAHPHCLPPDDYASLPYAEQLKYRTEANVLEALDSLGHQIRVVPLEDEVLPLRKAVQEMRPHVAFNLIEEFHGAAVYDHNVVGYLELLRVPYTGCNPRGLVVARDKALSKKILRYHHLPVPGFAVFRRRKAIKPPRHLQYPLIVKSLTEDASAGIAEASVVRSAEKLVERVQFVHENLQTPAIAEEYIDGRELYVGVLGRRRLTVLPIWEVSMRHLRPDAPRILTLRAKFDARFQDEHNLLIGPAEGLTDEQIRSLQRMSKRIYRALGLSGYARLDFRLDLEGRPFFIEANPNPDIARDAEFAHSAEAAGYTYEQLIQRIVALGLSSIEG